MSNLSAKQKRFVDEYIIDLNQTQAAIRAGYAEGSARTQGARLIANDNIQGYLNKRMAEKETELIADQNEILQSLTRQGRREELDYQIVVLKEKIIEDGVITETERTEIVKLPTKNNDTIRALELLGRRYTMWTDRQEVEMQMPTFVDDVDE